MTHSAHARHALPLLATLMLALACAGGGGEGEEDAGFRPFNALKPEVGVEQERQVGHEADLQIRAQLYQQDIMIDDPLVTGFINDLGQSLVEQLSEPRDFNYRFRVLREPTLNAFALPGGYIYFNSGTILAAHSLDELAGVMAHEIAHARRHHWARSVEATAVPSLVSQIVGIGLTIATGEIAPLIVAQGVSQGLQLAYTREFEAEADTVGTAFMARAGFDPNGMSVFFERLLAKQDGRGAGASIPPYLRSHPRAELRAEDAAARARATSIPGRVDPAMRERFRQVQGRVAVLLAQKRGTLQPEWPEPDRAFATRALTQASEQRGRGAFEAAVQTLLRAEEREPYDPRLPFARGETLRESGRLRDAATAFARAVALDPNTALAHYKLGETLYELGEQGRAIFSLEQAEGRFARPGPLAIRTHEMLKRLTFPVATRSGLSDDVAQDLGLNEPNVRSVESFPPRVGVRVYWARIEQAWREDAHEMEVRWVAPDGKVVHTSDALYVNRDGFLYARWKADAQSAAQPGIWQAELWLKDERADRRAFRVVPEGGATDSAGPGRR